MRVILTALALAATTSAAGAATMTFTGVGDDPDQTVWVENRIEADANGRQIGDFARPDAAHMDDSGSSYARFIEFSMYRPFHAKSFDIFPVGWDVIYEKDGELVRYDFDNVEITGYRNGEVVTQDRFNMLNVGSTYTFGSAFRSLDLLRIGFTPLFELPRDILVGSQCSPCTHFDIDNVTLAPVPLPATLGLLGFGAAALGSLRLTRRRR